MLWLISLGRMVILHNIPFSTFNLDISAPVIHADHPALFVGYSWRVIVRCKERKAHTSRFEPI